MFGAGFWNGFSVGMGFELMRRILVPVIIIYLLLLCWWWLGPEKPQCSSARKVVAQRVIDEVVSGLREVSRDINKVEVFHLKNDPTDFVTFELRKQLMEGGRFDLSGTPIMEKIKAFLNLRNDGDFNVEKARRYAKRKNLDGVIIGTLNQFETTADGVVLDGVLKLVLANTEDVLVFPLSSLPKQAQEDGAQRAETVAIRLAAWERFGFVVLVILLLPITLIKLIKTVLTRESNGAILAVLVLITVLDGFSIHFLMGKEGVLGSSFVFCILLLSAIVFNLFVFSFTHKRLPLRPGEY